MSLRESIKSKEKPAMDRAMFADIAALVLGVYKRQNGMYNEKATPAQKFAEIERDYADVAAVMAQMGEQIEGRGTLAKGLTLVGEFDDYTTHCNDRLAGRETRGDKTAKSVKVAFGAIHGAIKQHVQG